MFVGCFEISVSVIVKHVQSIGIIRGFFSAWGDLVRFSKPRGTEEIGLWFARGDQHPGWHYGYLVKPLFQFVKSLSTTEEHSCGKNCFLSKEIELFFIDVESFTFYFPAFFRKLAFSGLFENYKTIILSEKS